MSYWNFVFVLLLSCNCSLDIYRVLYRIMNMVKVLSVSIILMCLLHTCCTEEQPCEEGSCKKVTKSSTCDEDGDEPCFFDDPDEDDSKPVILRESGDGSYPTFEKLSRIEGAKKVTQSMIFVHNL